MSLSCRCCLFLFLFKVPGYPENINQSLIYILSALLKVKLINYESMSLLYIAYI